jgi:anti-anti-sigma factor
MATNIARASNSDYAFIHETLGDTSIIHVYGELDLASASEFEAAIAVTAEPGQKVRIDLEPCNYLDSTVLAVLIRAYKNYANRLSIVLPATGAVARIFEMTSLADVLPTVPAP